MIYLKQASESSKLEENFYTNPSPGCLRNKSQEKNTIIITQ